MVVRVVLPCWSSFRWLYWRWWQLCHYLLHVIAKFSTSLLPQYKPGMISQAPVKLVTSAPVREIGWENAFKMSKEATVTFTSIAILSSSRSKSRGMRLVVVYIATLHGVTSQSGGICGMNKSRANSTTVNSHAVSNMFHAHSELHVGHSRLCTVCSVH